MIDKHIFVNEFRKLSFLSVWFKETVNLVKSKILGELFLYYYYMALL